MTPGALHESWVRDVCRSYKGVQIVAWRRNLLTLVEGLGPGSVPSRRPDAYIIDRERQNALVFEVEVGGPLNGERITEWADLWCALDACDWTLGLAIVDRFGARKEIDLADVWLALLQGSLT